MSQARLTIEALGSQAEGTAELEGRKVFVPFTLPGEEITAEIDGDRGTLVSVQRVSPNRVPPICRHFGVCGGCALQHADVATYRAFKRDQVVHALNSRGFAGNDLVGELIPVEPGTRRRTTLAGKRSNGGIVLGYHPNRSHTIFALEECPVLRSSIVAALGKLRGLLDQLLLHRGTAEVHVTETDRGLDVSVTGGAMAIDAARRSALGNWLEGASGIIRLSVDGEQVAAKAAPTVRFSGHTVQLPFASFLQAVADAEAQLASHLLLALSRLRAKDRIADLFAGLGAFTLPLGERHEVLAVEWDRDAVAALSAAARQPGLRKIEVLRRDLFREPLSARELAPFAAVVFDPPRAGAQAQAVALAASAVRAVVAISCNPATFARDARILVDGGYQLEGVTPIDQFLYSPHVEVVATFTKPR